MLSYLHNDAVWLRQNLLSHDDTRGFSCKLNLDDPIAGVSTDAISALVEKFLAALAFPGAPHAYSPEPEESDLVEALAERNLVSEKPHADGQVFWSLTVQAMDSLSYNSSLSPGIRMLEPRPLVPWC